MTFCSRRGWALTLFAKAQVKNKAGKHNRQEDDDDGVRQDILYITEYLTIDSMRYQYFC